MSFKPNQRNLWKCLFTFILVLALYTFCPAQRCWSLDHGWIPCSTSDTLSDTLTGNYYVVARPEKYIKAFDQSKKLLWQTNPWKSPELIQLTKKYSWGVPPNVDSITVQTIDFPKTEYMGGTKWIVVYFSDRIVRALDKKDGRFFVLGQN